MEVHEVHSEIPNGAADERNLIITCGSLIRHYQWRISRAFIQFYFHFGANK